MQFFLKKSSESSPGCVDTSVAFVSYSSHPRVPSMPYDMAVSSLLDSMMLEKTITAVATNLGDVNVVVGGWDFIFSP